MLLFCNFFAPYNVRLNISTYGVKLKSGLFNSDRETRRCMVGRRITGAIENSHVVKVIFLFLLKRELQVCEVF